MKSFSSLAKFAEHLIKVSTRQFEFEQVALERIGKVIEKSAKAEIGHLQDAVGPFPEWAELADSTKDDKERKGYVYNEEYNPLLRTGELHDSYSHQVKGLSVLIGSPLDIAVYHEFGTSKMPERPVLGPAAFKNKKKIAEIIGAATVSGIIGNDKIHESLGYDMKVDLD